MKEGSRFKGPFRYDDYGNKIWMASEKGGETPVLDIRAWGYLTGMGGGALGLSRDEAISQQEEFANRIVGLLNKDAGHGRS